MSKATLMRLPDLLALMKKFKVKVKGSLKLKPAILSTIKLYLLEQGIKKLCSPVNGNDQTKDATETVLSHTKFCKKTR